MTTSVPSESPSLAELYARVRRCEDLEALRQLKVRYAQSADALWQAQNDGPARQMLELFTPDALIDLGPFGRYSGRETMQHAFHRLLPASTCWSTHYIVNALIEVDGDTASGHFYLLLTMQPRTPAGAPKAPPIQAYGHYVDKFVRTETGWKFSEVIATLDAPPA